MKVAGLFAGIGGIELGLHRAGHETLLLCENAPEAAEVLRVRFPDVRWHDDVRTLQELPGGTELLTAGFPCQDLSQAGKTRGITGEKSGLVGHVFRVLDSSPVPWLLIENVPFMLQLNGGEAMEVLVSAIEARGYRWAYRVVDSRAFGRPQRRRRVYFLASKVAAPEELLLRESVPEPVEPNHRGLACGFYWTEGTRGLGWAVDATPTIKGGSGLGIPSPPAIWMPDGKIVTPDIKDAERLQGFRAGWTKPAGELSGDRRRWQLVGNAVTVTAAAWIGEILSDRSGGTPMGAVPLRRARSWPNAAFGGKGKRWMAEGVTEWPRAVNVPPLAEFLRSEPKLLSAKATEGFLTRLRASSLRYPVEFEAALTAHLSQMKRRLKESVVSV